MRRFLGMKRWTRYEKSPSRTMGLEDRREPGAKRTARLCGLDNLSLLDAGGADAHVFRLAFDLRVDALKIGEPATPRLIVRVADIIAIDRPFTANSANFCHDESKCWKSEPEAEPI
jgi:hypothetical protein